MVGAASVGMDSMEAAAAAVEGTEEAVVEAGRPCMRPRTRPWPVWSPESSRPEGMWLPPHGMLPTL